MTRYETQHSLRDCRDFEARIEGNIFYFPVWPDRLFNSEAVGNKYTRLHPKMIEALKEANTNPHHSFSFIY